MMLRHPCRLLPMLLLACSFWGEAQGESVWRLEQARDLRQLSGPSRAGESQSVIPVYPEGGVWIPGKPSSQVQEEHGRLSFRPDGKDSLTTPHGFQVYGPAVDSIEIHMTVWNAEKIWFSWVPGSGSWGWSDEDAYCRIELPVQRPGEAAVWRLPTERLAHWTAREIQGLRLIVPADSRIEVKSITLNTGRALFAEKPWGCCEYRAHRELRPSLYTWTPMALSYPIPKKKVGERLHFSAGLLFVRQAETPQAQVTVSVKSAEGKQVLFQELVAGQESWRDISFALPEVGEGAQLILESAKATPNAILLWSNPTVFSTPEKENEAGKQRPNILVYVVDSLRADHLGLYGYERKTTPFLHDFAQEGLLFRRFLAAETCTKASMTTLMAGVDAMAHGMGCTGSQEAQGYDFFPSLLREAGYVTGAITENLYTPPNVESKFEFCELIDLEENTAARDGSTYGRVKAFLEKNQKRPFLLYVHTMEPHVRFADGGMVYDAPPPFLGTWGEAPEDERSLEDLSSWQGASRQFQYDRYDECISFADDNFRKVVAEVDRLGLAENTLVIFMADHGEGFGEHHGRIIHGYEPYEEQIAVPLLMRWRGHIKPGTMLMGCYGMIDIAPTLLDLAGLAPPSYYPGQSLVPCFQGEDIGESWARASYQGTKPGLMTHAALSQGAWKVMGSLWNPLLSLYDIRQDPGEATDKRNEAPDLFQDLRNKLYDYVRQQVQARRAAPNSESEEENAAIDPERIERLRNLGYLE